MEVPGDLRRQLSQAQEEYRAATEASDPDYDYEGQLQKIKELQRQINEADNPAETAGEKELGGYDLDKYGDPHPERGEMGRDGLRTCRDTGALEDELNDFRAAKLKNDSGEYFARIRNKSEGGVLLTIDLDGKRAGLHHPRQRRRGRGLRPAVHRRRGPGLRGRRAGPEQEPADAAADAGRGHVHREGAGRVRAAEEDQSRRGEQKSPGESGTSCLPLPGRSFVRYPCKAR